MRSVLSVAVLAGSLVLLCQPAHAAAPKVRQDSVIATDIVEYQCTTGATERQNIKVKVELTLPADARTGEQMTIGWRGTYIDDTGLRAPAGGLSIGTNLYVYASISGLPKLTSATGVGALGTASAGEIIPLPTTTVSMKTKSSNAGTATVKPAAMNFGPKPSERSIECEVQNAADLTTYTLTVTAAGPPTSPTPSASPTPSTTSPRPTHTVTETVTTTPANEDGNGDRNGNANGKVTKIPAGAAETGGGGAAGPDGRMLVLSGLLLTLAAVTGLLLRRRTLPRR